MIGCNLRLFQQADKRNSFEISQIYAFVFDRAPQAFHKDIVQSPAFAIHADLNIAISEAFCELLACELTPLIGIEYRWLSILQSSF